MTITPLAEVLLKDHAQRSTTVFYDIDVLGSLFKGDAIVSLDAAYAELVSLGLMESAGTIIHFFGVPKGLYRITKAGHQRASAVSAA